jgi:hypothetical protein
VKYADRYRLATAKPAAKASRYKYGLKPVTEQPRVTLRDYYTSGLPSVDSLKFPLGHADAIQPQMFLNDQLGCCEEAGFWEEVRLANALRGVTVNVSDASVLKTYEEIAGYNPDDPSTDQGSDVHAGYQYRKTTGLVDDDGNVHKIVAYAGLTPGDWDELLVALSLFDMVGIGILVPSYAQQQFAAGQPWDVEPGEPNIEGGHYIPVVGAQSATLGTVYTWGARQGMTQAFYEAFNTVAVVALTEELFKELQANLPEFNTGNVSSKAPKAKRKDADYFSIASQWAPDAEPTD